MIEPSTNSFGIALRASGYSLPKFSKMSLVPSSVGADVIRHQRRDEVELGGGEFGIGDFHVFADDAFAVGAVALQVDDRLSAAFHIAIGESRGLGRANPRRRPRKSRETVSPSAARLRAREKPERAGTDRSAAAPRKVYWIVPAFSAATRLESPPICSIFKSRSTFNSFLRNR